MYIQGEKVILGLQGSIVAVPGSRVSCLIQLLSFWISFELRAGWQFPDTDRDAVPCSES